MHYDLGKLWQVLELPGHAEVRWVQLEAPGLRPPQVRPDDRQQTKEAEGALEYR